MENIKKLLLENKAWAKGHADIDPAYFENLAKGQKPDILWIGCADSRVPPDEIINSRPGTLFVHRNIANIIHANDENFLSVLEFAIRFLKVRYVIVCGHYNCGGVQAAFEGIENDRLTHWTESVRELKEKHNPKSINELVEISVCAQVEKLKSLPVIQEAWKAGEYPKILGWVYNLHNGLLKELTLYDPAVSK
ncbi:MAG: carbonic anhydrase [Halobacteriovoraceae bacterium]|nr:carbonic anhydrase [Halobacteriovoraceae bacterium]MCB9095299.1 carbonic anhydrase [Halobacteriovoraceae bacterium]